MEMTIILISIGIAVGLMYIIKSNGWDFWNDKEDRWK